MVLRRRWQWLHLRLQTIKEKRPFATVSCWSHKHHTLKIITAMLLEHESWNLNKYKGPGRKGLQDYRFASDLMKFNVISQLESKMRGGDKAPPYVQGENGVCVRGSCCADIVLKQAQKNAWVSGIHWRKPPRESWYLHLSCLSFAFWWLKIYLF